MPEMSRWEPQGRFREFMWHFTVEVTDEKALRTFGFDTMADEQGNVIGMVDWNDNEKIGWILTRLMFETLQQAGPDLGFNIHGGGMPMARSLDEDGQYAEFTMGARPVTRDDGQMDGEWPPKPQQDSDEEQ